VCVLCVCVCVCFFVCVCACVNMLHACVHTLSCEVSVHDVATCRAHVSRTHRAACVEDNDEATMCRGQRWGNDGM